MLHIYNISNLRVKLICYEGVLLAVFCLPDKKYRLLRQTRGCGLIHCRCARDSFPCQGHGRLDAGRQILLRASEIVDWRAGVCLFVLLALSHTPVQFEYWKEGHRTFTINCTSHQIFAVLCSHFWHTLSLYSVIGVHLTLEILF